jgi:hypothetical protein
MIPRKKHLQLVGAILAVVGVLIAAPSLGLAHAAPRWQPLQQTNLSGPHRFVKDDSSAATSKAQTTSIFKSIILELAIPIPRASRFSRTSISDEARVVWPLRRLLPCADSEDPLI